MRPGGISVSPIHLIDRSRDSFMELAPDDPQCRESSVTERSTPGPQAGSSAPRQTVERLNLWMESLRDRSTEAWLFPSESGVSPLSRDNVWRRNMLPALSRVGLEWANFQVMRRSNASLSHKAGVDPKVAADQRGHGLGTSMSDYIEADLEQKRQAAIQLEAACGLGEPPTDSPQPQPSEAVHYA